MLDPITTDRGKRPRTRPLSFLFSIIILIGCAVTPEKTNFPRLTVFYSANRQGEVEPCGCQVHQLGGLNRMAVFLEESRKGLGKRTQLLVDAGDTFFSSNPLNTRRIEQEKIRAATIADSYRQLHWDAFTPGERDFAAGLGFLRDLQKRSGAVFISSNLKDQQGNTLFENFHIFDLQGQKVGVMSLTSPDVMSRVSSVVVEDPVQAFSRTLQELKKGGAEIVILLSHLGLERDREFAKRGGVDLIVGSHSLDSLQKPEVYGTTAVVQTLYQGQQMGRIELSSSQPNVTNPLLVDMEDTFDKPSAVTAVVAAYRETIRSRGLEPIDVVQAPLPLSASRPVTDERFRANVMTCRTCHKEQYEFWAKTNHAAAAIVLYAKNQHFDPECIACHSLGFEQPGGFEKIARPYVLSPQIPDKKGTSFVEKIMKDVFGKGPVKSLDSRLQPARYAKLHRSYVRTIQRLESEKKILKWFLDVQCENCHGERVGHPGNETIGNKKVQESTCRTCHTAPNAPNFQPSMMAKVACPLMNR